MTQAELNALVNGLIIDNNTNQVTPAKVRAVFFAVIDSIQQTNLSEITANEPLNYDAFNNLFTILQADISTNGYLSLEDWKVFNEKQELLSEINFGAFSNNLTTEDTIADGDLFNFVDVSDSNKQKKTGWANIKNKLKAYFDTFYQGVLVSGTNIKTVNGSSLLGSGDLVVSGGGSFVPTTRELTINGVTQDLSTDRSWTISEQLVLSDVTKHTHTGSTSNTLLSTITIPANYIPNNSVWEVHVCGSRGASGVAGSALISLTLISTVGNDFIRNANIGTGANFKLHMYRTLIFRNGNVEFFSQDAAGFATDFTSAQGIVIGTFDRTIAQSLKGYITLANSSDTAYLDYLIFRRIA